MDQNLIIIMDLSQLYFAIRNMGQTVNYRKMIEEILRGREARKVAFTVFDPANEKQASFLDRLRKWGVDVRTFPSNTPSNFTPEMSVIAGSSPESEIILVTGDDKMIRPFRLLEASGKKVELVFFSERLSGGWNPLILSGQVNFFDLSNPDVKKRLTN